jgi:predicted kinase
MTTLHLMHGFIGSGKTTFAKKLSQDIGAIRLNNDEWMVALYGTNPPQELFNDYYSRIENLMYSLTAQLLRNGQDVILDIGFWTREHRDQARKLAQDNGASYKFYAMICPEEIQLKRTLTRTVSDKNGLYIDEAAFIKLKKIFEPLDVDEPHEAIITG